MLGVLFLFSLINSPNIFSCFCNLAEIRTLLIFKCPPAPPPNFWRGFYKYSWLIRTHGYPNLYHHCDDTSVLQCKCCHGWKRRPGSTHNESTRVTHHWDVHFSALMVNGHCVLQLSRGWLYSGALRPSPPRGAVGTFDAATRRGEPRWLVSPPNRDPTFPPPLTLPWPAAIWRGW